VSIEKQARTDGVLRVLHGPGGSAGQPACIARAQRRQGVLAHAIRLGDNKFNYQADIVLPANGPSSYCNAFTEYANKYDVFHFYFRPFFYHNMNCGYPMGLDVLSLRASGKVVIIHYRGSEIRLHSVFKESSPHNYVSENPYNLVSKFPEESQKSYLNLMKAVCNEILVTDPELLTYCPGAKIVPRAIDLCDWPYIGVSDSDAPPLIVHAPSRRAVKGTDILMSALDQLRHEGINYRIKLVENMTNDEAREVYCKADIIVDQLRIGWYGVLSVEAMALGKPVLSYIREDLREHLPKESPLVVTSPETLLYDLRKVILQRTYRNNLSRNARSYVQDVHDSKKIASSLLAFYMNCQQNPKPIDFPELGKYIDALPYYHKAQNIVELTTIKDKSSFQKVSFYYKNYGIKTTVKKILNTLSRR
jgi:glycosyltransferase involved in cell wall biosynthesis